MKFKVASPVPEEVIQILWIWSQQFADQMLDDRRPKDVEAMQAAHREEIANGGKQYYFSSENDVPLGMVWASNVGDDMYFGHLVFEREGLSTADKVEMTKYALHLMFMSGARKVIWQLFSDNRAFKIFLKKCGAEYEGCLRQMVRRNGVLMDTVMMASFPKEQNEPF